MTQQRSVEQRLNDILEAINRARVADKRLKLTQSLADEVGLQIAFQAILHNLTVIGDSVHAIPGDVLARNPETPWRQIEAMREVTVHNYRVIDTAAVHRIVESDLDLLESAVRRLQAAR